MPLIYKSAGDGFVRSQCSQDGPYAVGEKKSPHTLSRRAFLGATGSFLAAVSLGGRVAFAQDRKVRAKVGFLLCDKGPYASESTSLLLGMEAYLKDKYPHGGPFEILKADAGPLGEKTVDAVTELAVNRGVRFLVSPPVLDAARNAVQALAGGKTIHFVTCRSLRLVAGEMCLPESFRVSGNSYQVAAPLAPWALKALGAKVFLTGADDPLCSESADAFAYFFEKSGGMFVDRLPAASNSEDFGDLVELIGKKGPDFVFAAFGDPQGTGFLRALRSAKLTANIPVAGPEFLTPYPEAPSGVKAKEFSGVKTLSTLKSPKETLAFLRKKVNKPPACVARAAEGYDTALIISAALQAVQGGESDTAALVKAIEEINSQGLRGKFRFDANHEVILPGHVVGWELRNGVWETSPVKDLGPLVSPDFGCGKVGFPKGPETETKDEEDPLDAIDE